MVKKRETLSTALASFGLIEALCVLTFLVETNLFSDKWAEFTA